MNFDPTLLTISYAMLLGTIGWIYSTKIKTYLKNTIAEYIKFMESVPLQHTIGK